MKNWKILLFTIFFAGLVSLSACGTAETEDENTDESDDIAVIDDTETEEDIEDSEIESEDVEVNEVEDIVEGDINENDEPEEISSEDVATDNESAENDQEIVLENDQFRIFTPAENAVVESEFTVSGEASIADGVVHYEFEDGHNILDEGTIDLGTSAPDWGAFEFTINFDEVAFNNGTVILYERSDDGSMVNQLYIPVTVE